MHRSEERPNIFSQEAFQQDSLISSNMDNYSTYPYSYYESSSLFADEPVDSDYDMIRSASPNNMQQRHDIAPSLLSSAGAPSVPSASSSTVGSPYTGPLQMVSNVMFVDASSTYLNGPAIVCDDGFSHAYETGHYSYVSDIKSTGPCVGEYADLSSLAQRSPKRTTQVLTAPILTQSPTPINAALERVTSSLPKRDQSVHGLPQDYVSLPPIQHITHRQSTSDDGLFKSPSIPASAYTRTSSSPSPSMPKAQPIRDAFNPMRQSVFPMQHFGYNDQYSFYSQTSGNCLPPLETSYPILISGQQDQFLSASPYNTFPPPRQIQHYSPAASTAPSPSSFSSFPQQPASESQPTPSSRRQRRLSIGSAKSGASHRTSLSADDETREKGKCPFPECGKVFRDLKTHLLTHSNVRPEKCPIPDCEYNIKGFARKYDKNRHTLTHFRGTMVCGFCPGSGSAAEKSFNRADVFKRHLTSVHGVEQTAPNSRKRNSSRSSIKLSSYCHDATGRCSTCGATFSNAQDFYEHLDDCVLKIVQQEDPSVSINKQRMAEVANDAEVASTFERNHVKQESDGQLLFLGDDDDDDDEDDDEEDEEDAEDRLVNERSGKGVIKSSKSGSSRPIIGGNVSKKTKSNVFTWSRGGGAIVGKSRKRRKFYPPSWGMATDKMNMKKRVLCCFDGPRRLLKDDMMMHSEYEVRMPLTDGSSYVTDLDVETLKRAEAFHNATSEEKGVWAPEQDSWQEFLQ